MSKLPTLTYKELIQKLRKAGFEFDRQAKGSHEIWYNPKTKKRTTIPHHAGSIPRGTLRAILNQCDISVEDISLL
ncbi:MAG: type II toxin-antitoxin system HicA family toxin [Chloroherpetonaceae bacterium]|nr:type II toxin-antitoxin system HicA family toxin [Chloroherpetonaceae bacterium]